MDNDDVEFCLRLAPIAFHFFPDGPRNTPSSADGQFVWPQPSPTDSRTIVSSRQSQDALPDLQEYCLRGLTAAQMSAVVLVACAMVSPSKSIRSPLANAQHFRALLKCLTLRSSHIMHKDAVLRITSCLNLVDVYSRRCILRFLYLVAQIQDLPYVYPIILVLTNGDTCVDAVRLLLRITKQEHVKVFMAQRIRNRLDHLIMEDSKHTSSSSTLALAALLRLYARLNPDCQDFATSVKNNGDTSWHEFRDSEWEQDFFAPRELNLALKRRHVGRLQRLDGALDIPTGCHTSSIESCLDNHDLHHRVILSTQMGDGELARLQTVLPFLLKERMHFTKEMSHNETVKRILSSMCSFASQTDVLLPELQNFLESSLLPNWDGTGTVLLEVLTGWSPCPFAELKSRVLVHLQRFLLSGDSELQYRIIHALTFMTHRWGRLDWTVETLHTPPLDKVHTLRDLVLWVDTVLVKAFVMSNGDDFDNEEILQSASIQFYSTICELSDDCGFLGVPSASLFYRLLLSRSALFVDRLCHLLVSYKRSFGLLKEQTTAALESVSKENDERIRVYNCYVWDVCSVLWLCPPPPPPQPRNDADTPSRALSLLFTEFLRPHTQTELHHLALDDKSIVAKALSITHGAVFVGFAQDFARHRISEDGHNALDRIRGKIKVRYLDYLKERGFSGIHSFLSTFVGSLANRSKR